MHCTDPFSFKGKLIHSDNEEMSRKSEVQTLNFWQLYVYRHICLYFYIPNELSFASQDVLCFISETVLLFHPGVSKHCLCPSKSSTGHSPQNCLFMVHKIWITFSHLFPC